MHMKNIARWLFGRRYGATILVSQATEHAIKNHDLQGLCVRGRVPGVGVYVQTGKKEGGWQLTANRIPGGREEAELAEKGIPLFLREVLKDDQNLFAAAKLLDLVDVKKLRASVERVLGNPDWHMKVDPDGEATLALEQWVMSHWAANRPQMEIEEAE